MAGFVESCHERKEELHGQLPYLIAPLHALTQVATPDLKPSMRSHNPHCYRSVKKSTASAAATIARISSYVASVTGTKRATNP